MKRPYLTQMELCEEFGLGRKAVSSRLKEIRALKSRYGSRSIIDDGNIVLVFVPAFVDYMSNRRMLLDKNISKYVEPYRPGEIIQELGMHEWGTAPVEPKEPEISKDTIKELVREVLLEGLSA